MSGGIDREDMHTLVPIHIPDVANPLTHRMHKGVNTTVDEGVTPIAFSSNMSEPDACEEHAPPVKGGGKAGNPPAVAFQQNSRDEVRFTGGDGDVTGALAAQAGMKQQNYVCVHWQQGGGEVEDEVSGSLRADAEHNYQFLRQNMHVRRLTPVECERLQGFPDNYTRIAWRGKSADDCPDGPRYKALGNSMAVPVMRWIGERIQQVSRI